MEDKKRYFRAGCCIDMQICSPTSPASPMIAVDPMIAMGIAVCFFIHCTWTCANRQQSFAFFARGGLVKTSQ
jgi:hypothetical protein